MMRVRSFLQQRRVDRLQMSIAIDGRRGLLGWACGFGGNGTRGDHMGNKTRKELLLALDIDALAPMSKPARRVLHGQNQNNIKPAG